jgi:hypothetical protein
LTSFGWFFAIHHSGSYTTRRDMFPIITSSIAMRTTRKNEKGERLKKIKRKKEGGSSH